MVKPKTLLIRTANGNYAAVKAYVNSKGDHRVDIVATDIIQVDPITGDSAEIYPNNHDLMSKKRCVFNWENTWLKFNSDRQTPIYFPLVI